MQKTIVRRTEPTDSAVFESIHPLLARIYRNRGLQSSQDLQQDFAHLLPTTCLKNRDEAVTCLYNALRQQQHILILGDFDADGATSTALAVRALKLFGAKNVSYLVPNRFEYGYGLTPEIVEVAARRKPYLIVTVDNGISSVDGVARANALGIKVLITDHHLPGPILPEAEAIVNPNQEGDFFPSKNLAGVGVIFYIMLSLRRYLREVAWFSQHNISEPNMSDLLDLVALGTVADVVPLDQNNRILVQKGLQRIRAGKACLGIQALLEVSGRSASRLVASDLGFAVGPRLNAAGRLEDMSLGIECLLALDYPRAQHLAMRLDQLNKERREIEATMQQQAIEALTHLQAARNLPRGVCVYDATWHQGVIGIVASRVKDRYHRPVIAFAPINEREFKGSARSISGLHIRDILDAIAKRHPHLISKFGGHAMAAGLTIASAHYSEFAEAFAQEVSRHIQEADLQGRIISDGELTAADFSLEVAEMLRLAGPWGQGFPEPLFDNHFMLVNHYLVGGNHLKMQLAYPGTSQLLDAIAFNVDVEHWPNHRAEKIHAAYRLDVNEFRGQRNVQLIVEHFEIV